MPLFIFRAVTVKKKKEWYADYYRAKIYMNLYELIVIHKLYKRKTLWKNPYEKNSYKKKNEKKKIYALVFLISTLTFQCTLIIWSLQILSMPANITIIIARTLLSQLQNTLNAWKNIVT